MFDFERVQPLPYLGHVEDNQILLRDGSRMAMVHMVGSPYHHETNAARNREHELQNTLLVNIGGDNVSVHVHFVRHEGVIPQPHVTHRSAYAAMLYEDHHASLGTLYSNDWYFTIVVHPPLKGLVASSSDLEEKIGVVISTYAKCLPTRLGIREAGGVCFSEMAEALRLILTSKWLPVPMAEDLDGIYTDRAICGPRGIEIRAPVPHYAVIFGFRSYMRGPRVGMFNGLLSAKCRVVMTNGFRYIGRANSVDSLSLKTRQLENAGDAGGEEAGDELADAMSALMHGDYLMGSHHWSCAIHGDTLPATHAAAGEVRGLLQGNGVNLAMEGRLGGESAYWAQLVGFKSHRTRPGTISTANFARMASLNSYPRGETDGYWDHTSPFRLALSAGTAYDHQAHIGDVGHIGMFGPNSGGKTTWMSFNIAMMDAFVGGQGGTQIVFDKGRANEISVLALGGRYTSLGLGRTGMAPLRRLANTEKNRAWLLGFIDGLIQSDGRGAPLPKETDDIARGIDFIMSRPQAERSFDGIRQFIAFDEQGRGAGERFQQWCRGGARGWVFDNEVDELDFDCGLVGVDPTELLDDPVICPPMASYLLYLSGQIVDGRRGILWADEFKAYLPDARFAAGFEDFSLRMRKKNWFLGFATQQPEHILDHPIGPSLLGQCKQFALFRNPDANRAAYCGGGKWGDGLHCTPGEFRAVTTEMTVGPRSVLLRRESGSVLCKFDLSSPAMAKHLAVLSGRDKTVALFRECKGDLQQFWSRLHEARA